MGNNTYLTYWEPVPHVVNWGPGSEPPDPPWKAYRYRWVERLRGVVVKVGMDVVYCYCRQDYLDLMAHWGGYDKYAAHHEVGSVYEYYVLE